MAGSPPLMTAEGLDWVLAGIEASLVKIHAAAGKRVRLQQAELDFLKKLEVCRDFMERVLKQKADTDTIKAIFGGDGGGLGKARALLEAAELSAQNARDPRLESCLRACNRLEAARCLPSTTPSKRAVTATKPVDIKGGERATGGVVKEATTEVVSPKPATIPKAVSVAAEGGAKDEVAIVKKTPKEEQVEKEAEEQEKVEEGAGEQTEQAQEEEEDTAAARAAQDTAREEDAARQAEELQRRQNTFMQELKMARRHSRGAIELAKSVRAESCGELQDPAEEAEEGEVGEDGEVRMTVVPKSKKVTLLDWYTSEAAENHVSPRGEYESKIRTLLVLEDNDSEDD